MTARRVLCWRCASQEKPNNAHSVANHTKTFGKLMPGRWRRTLLGRSMRGVVIQMSVPSPLTTRPPCPSPPALRAGDRGISVTNPESPVTSTRRVAAGYRYAAARQRIAEPCKTLHSFEAGVLRTRRRIAGKGRWLMPASRSRKDSVTE